MVYFQRRFHNNISNKAHTAYRHIKLPGLYIRGLMRGMATLPQGNQELLVVKYKVGRPQVSLGKASLWNVIFTCAP